MTDPRVIKTRKAIMEAFIELSAQKEFKTITVKDITEAAMINRATFYYHFADIYDVLEQALLEVFHVNLQRSRYVDEGLSEILLWQLYEAITAFQCALHQRCHNDYEMTIARIIREQIALILQTKLQQSGCATSEVTAQMWSWSLYGLSMQKNVAPEHIKQAILQLVYGVDL